MANEGNADGNDDVEDLAAGTTIIGGKLEAVLPASTKARHDTGRTGEDLMSEKKKKAARLQRRGFEDMRSILKQKLIQAGYASGGFSLKKIFKGYDKDDSGDICYDEFRRAIRKEAKVTVNQLSDQSLYKIFRQVDRDGGGSIEIEEFGKWLDVPTDTEVEMGIKKSRATLYREGRSQTKTQTFGGPSKSSSSTGKNLSRSLTPSRSMTPSSTRDLRDKDDARMMVFDEQIDRLLGLVRVQTEEVAQMRMEHAEQVAYIRMEYDALVAALQSSGVVSTDRLNAELAKQKAKQNRQIDAVAVPSRHGRAPATRNSAVKSPRSPRSPRSPASAGSTEPYSDANDLYALAHPLFQRYAPNSAKASALAKIEAALNKGASPDKWRGVGTPLHGAEQIGSSEFVHLLLDKFANVNAVDDRGVSVLTQACYDGRTEMVKLLLDRLADPNQKDRHEQSPFFFAPSRQVCEALYAAHADVAAINVKGQSALHMAARAGLQDVLGWLAKHVPRSLLDLKDSDGFSAVEYAQRAGTPPVVLNRLRTWEPRLVERKDIIKRDEIDESEMERRRRLWELAHREQTRREQMAKKSPIAKVMKVDDQENFDGDEAVDDDTDLGETLLLTPASSAANPQAAQQLSRPFGLEDEDEADEGEEEEELEGDLEEG